MAKQIGDKDAEEEFADFGYRVPVEFVAGQTCSA